MADLYNLTNLSSANTLDGQIVAVNQLTDGVFGTIFLLALFVFFLITFRHNGVVKVLIADGFITGIVAIIFWAIGLCSINVVVYPFIISFVAIIAQIWAVSSGYDG